MSVILYTKENCVYCRVLKRDLQNEGIEFEEITIGDGNRQMFLDKFPGRKSVPLLVVDDKVIGGLDESMVWIEGEIKK